MDIDKVYNDLLSEYGLIKKETVEAIIKEKINYIVRQWNKKVKNKKVILWGAGEHTKQLFNFYEIDKKNIVAIVDKNHKIWGKNIDGIKIIGKKEIKNYNVDAIVISSLAFVNEIKKEINSIGYDYINLYENVEEDKKYIMQANLNLNFEHNSFLKYMNIFYLKEMYYKNKSEFLLNELIIEYLNIKDFLSSKRFINEYINKNYSKAERYKKFLISLDRLIEQIELKIKENKKKKIIFTVCDALKYDDIENAYKGKNNLKWLGEVARNSLYYRNSFSTSTYTRACFKGMFEKSMILKDYNSNNREYILYEKNNNIINLILKENYLIINNCTCKIKSIDNNENIINNINNCKDYRCCTEQLWDMISYICKYNKDIFVINHFLESHASYFGGENTSVDIITPLEIITNKYLKDKALKQYNEAIGYLDKQMKFYYSLLSDDTYNIITNDHGQPKFNGIGIERNHYSWSEYIIKSPIIISSKYLNSKVIDDLISKLDIDEIIKSIIYSQKIPNVQKEFVNVQRNALYNINLVKGYLKTNEEVKFTKAFSIIRTINEKFVLYEDGKEEFYLMPNEYRNEIMNKKYYKRIKELRSLIDDSFVQKNKDI